MLLLFSRLLVGPLLSASSSRGALSVSHSKPSSQSGTRAHLRLHRAISCDSERRARVSPPGPGIPGPSVRVAANGARMDPPAGWLLLPPTLTGVVLCAERLQTGRLSLTRIREGQAKRDSDIVTRTYLSGTRLCSLQENGPPLRRREAFIQQGEGLSF